MLHLPSGQMLVAYRAWLFSMTPLIKQFAASESGLTSVEYVVIAASVPFAIIASVTALFYSVGSEAITAIQ
jgi:Flp pilus assembly pilin Flp